MKRRCLFPLAALALCSSLFQQAGLAQDAPASPVKPPGVVEADPSFPAFNRPKFSRYSGPPRMIGEGGGARLWHHCGVYRPGAVVITFYHHLAVTTPDGRHFILFEGRSSSPKLPARMNRRGNVALASEHGLKVFFAPDYKPVNILKLRSDRFLKTAPDFNYFTTGDVSWGEGVLVCNGHLSMAESPSKRTHGTVQYPFLSRLFVDDDKREVRDHQILWTTWRTGLVLHQQNMYSGQHPAANGIEGSLHLQHDLALWRNAGNDGHDSFPAELPQDFAKAGWQCTNLATGKTGALGTEDDVDRALLDQIEGDTEKSRKGQQR